MGMFDWVKYEAECQKEGCNNVLTQWQSKDGYCVLNNLTPEKLLEQGGGYSTFYDSCSECGTWNTFTIIPPTPMRIKAGLHSPEHEDEDEHTAD